MEKVLEEIKQENGKNPFIEIKSDFETTDDLPPPLQNLETKKDSSGCVNIANTEDSDIKKKSNASLKQSTIVDQFCKIQSTLDKEEIKKNHKRKRDLEDEECIMNKKTVV